jgi:prophage regulatory protein
MQENRIKLIKLPQVMQITTLSRATVYRLIAKGEFPKQIKLGPRSSGWLESEIDSWISDCASKRDKTVK